MKNSHKIKRIFVLLSFALIFIFLFSACSGSDKSSDSENGGNNFGAYYDRADSYESYDYSPEAEKSAQNTVYDLLASNSSSSANLPAARKIIRDANVTMEVEDVEESFDNILSNLSSIGGYEANRDMRTGNDNYITISTTLKIPAGELDEFLRNLNEEGKVISSNISSNDITDQYYDSKTRLTTLEKTLEKYYEFLDNAETVEEQLQVTEYINNITYEIEQIKGSLNRWDSLVEYSTISLSLYSPYEAPKPERVITWSSLSFGDMIWLISSGFIGVCNAIFSVLQWILIAIATMSPIIIPVAVILIIVIRHYNKQKKQRQIKQTNQEKQVNNNNDDKDKKF